MEVLRLLHEPAVGLRENELVHLRTVNKDAALAGSVVVSRGVVLAIDARVEDGVHEKVRHGVGQGRPDVAKAAVNGPHVNALWHLLFLLGGVGIVLVEVSVALVASRYVSLFVNLVIGLSRCCQS